MGGGEHSRQTNCMCKGPAAGKGAMFHLSDFNDPKSICLYGMIPFPGALTLGKYTGEDLGSKV